MVRGTNTTDKQKRNYFMRVAWYFAIILILGMMLIQALDPISIMKKSALLGHAWNSLDNFVHILQFWTNMDKSGLQCWLFWANLGFLKWDDERQIFKTNGGEKDRLSELEASGV